MSAPGSFKTSCCSLPVLQLTSSYLAVLQLTVMQHCNLPLGMLHYCILPMTNLQYCNLLHAVPQLAFNYLAVLQPATLQTYLRLFCKSPVA